MFFAWIRDCIKLKQYKYLKIEVAYYTKYCIGGRLKNKENETSTK